jgi:hypothetical protein
MTLFYSQHDRLRDPAGRSPDDAAAPRLLARHVLRQAVNALKLMHRAIVTAKTRRLARELMLHAGSHYDDVGSDAGGSDGKGSDAATIRSIRSSLAISGFLAAAAGSGATGTAGIEFDFARQFDDGLPVTAVLEQRLFDRLRPVDEQAAIKAVLLLRDPVAAFVPANKDDGRYRAARWRFNELHVSDPCCGEQRASLAAA